MDADGTDPMATLGPMKVMIRTLCSIHLDGAGVSYDISVVNLNVDSWDQVQFFVIVGTAITLEVRLISWADLIKNSFGPGIEPLLSALVADNKILASLLSSQPVSPFMQPSDFANIPLSKGNKTPRQMADME